MPRCANLLIAFLFVPASVMSQARVSFDVNYGTYLMTHLKGLEEEIPASFPVSMKTLSSYPPYFNYDGSLIYQTRRRLFWGLILGYGSTGARTHYSDYSGFVSYDQRINYFSMHVSLGLARKYPDKNLQLDFDLRPGVMFTNYDLVVSYEIGDTPGGQTDEFKSVNVAIQPTAVLRKRLGHFGVEALLGINVNVVRGKLFHLKDKEAYLTNSWGGALRADWTGVRVGLGGVYYFKSKRE